MKKKKPTSAEGRRPAGAGRGTGAGSGSGPELRLHVFLARSGVASRRAAEEMIAQGRVKVNGRTVTEPGTKVRPASDQVRVDGKRVERTRTVWIALHKPAGYVTTRDDPEGRRTVYDLLPEELHGLFHVGRLDRASMGLLLLTNDGETANRLLHPRYQVSKEYVADVEGEPDSAALARLLEGVESEGETLKAEEVRLVSSDGESARLRLVLVEGKRHEVRRMLDAVGHPVTRLVRDRFGPIQLERLPRGKWRKLTEEEVRSLRSPVDAAGTRSASPKGAGGAGAAGRAGGGSRKAGAGKPGAGKPSARDPGQAQRKRGKR